MKTFRLIRFIAICLPLWLSSCSEQSLIAPESTSEEIAQGSFLTLHATSQADTRVAIDGLTMKWENGDKLLLVDVDGINPDVELVTTLDEPSTSAVFKSTEIVIPGNYRAVYVGTDTQSWDRSFRVKNDFERPITGNDMRLVSEEFAIQSGQTDVTIQMKHIYCQLYFNISGFESGDWSLGMVSDNEVIPRKMDFAGNESFDDISWYYRLPFYPVCCDGNEKEYAVLLLPKDYSAGKVTFYMTKQDGETVYCYLFEKVGKDLKAGTKYKINLAKENAHLVTISNGEIATADQFRALNYSDISAAKLIDDIDLSPITSLKPIQNSYITLDGNNKTISNVNITCNHDRVGLFCGNITVTNLTLSNIHIKGLNHVGGLSGINGSNITNCSLTGTNVIEGVNRVGGLVGALVDANSTNNIRIYSGTHVKGNDYVGTAFGYANFSPSDIKVEAGCTVIGNDYVGGIAGQIYKSYSESNTTKCYSGATVNGNNYVGGIAGTLLSCTLCGNIGNVTATGNYVGGICARTREWDNDVITKCYNTGNIKGNFEVGGICGRGNIELSFSTGNVEASTYAGGILGASGSVKNSYSLATVTSEGLCGGIIGYQTNVSTISNCYFAGNCQGGGISGNGTTNITNCLTTSRCWSPDIENEYANLTDIFANISIINSDGAYSTDPSTIWDTEVYPARCPKLNWQLDNGQIEGGTDIPGWSEEEW